MSLPLLQEMAQIFQLICNSTPGSPSGDQESQGQKGSLVHSPGSRPHNNSISLVFPVLSLPSAWRSWQPHPSLKLSEAHSGILFSRILGIVETDTLRNHPDTVNPSLLCLPKGETWDFGSCRDRILGSLLVLSSSHLISGEFPASFGSIKPQEANFTFNLTIPCRSMFEHK